MYTGTHVPENPAFCPSSNDLCTTPQMVRELYVQLGAAYISNLYIIILDICIAFFQNAKYFTFYPNAVVSKLCAAALEGAVLEIVPAASSSWLSWLPSWIEILHEIQDCSTQESWKEETATYEWHHYFGHFANCFLNVIFAKTSKGRQVLLFPYCTRENCG